MEYSLGPNKMKSQKELITLQLEGDGDHPAECLF